MHASGNVDFSLLQLSTECSDLQHESVCDLESTEIDLLYSRLSIKRQQSRIYSDLKWFMKIVNFSLFFLSLNQNKRNINYQGATTLFHFFIYDTGSETSGQIIKILNTGALHWFCFSILDIHSGDKYFKLWNFCILFLSKIL